jgi:hypothetical protein
MIESKGGSVMHAPKVGKPAMRRLLRTKVKERKPIEAEANLARPIQVKHID